MHKIFQNPAILLNLESDELLPLKEIIKTLKSQLEKFEKGFQRRDKIFEYLKNLKQTDVQKIFPAYEGDERIFRLKYMLANKIFEVKISEEKFLSIMDKYFKVKDERNHSNHARPDETGEFETAADLEKFMKGGIDEIEH